MLHNWLQVPAADFPDPADYAPHQIGGRIIRLTARKRRLPDGLSVALIGLDAEAARGIRRHLYKLSWRFDRITVADLGDIRRGGANFLTPLLKELLDAEIIPLLIGGAPADFRAQYQAMQELNRQLSLLTVDSAPAFGPEKDRDPEHYLSSAVHGKRRPIFHLTALGTQIQQVDRAVEHLMADRYYDNIRLGQAREDLSLTEPYIREADLIGLHLRSLRHGSAPARGEDYNPSGFEVEEACRLVRYAGLSDKLRSFGIYGFRAAPDPAANELTAATCAQLLWYFMDGVAGRWGDYPASLGGLTEYIVDQSGTGLTFWKSNRSGRWWIQAPAGRNRKGEERHRLIPCSYQDYQTACRDELPDRLLQAFQRYQ
ncbi:MAG: hypothetical protein WBA17_04595 [Saprospiraceae bacterium]